MNGLLDAALGYAARGWPVFPCQAGRKEPATLHGFKDATTDPAEIRAWWAINPAYNIGIATGHPGPDVTDFDTGDGTGLAALATLTTTGLLNGRGLLVRTRSGGWHAYYAGTTQHNATLKRKTGPSADVDFRGHGGYVIAPPSYVEADDKPGGYYEVVSDGAPQPGTLDWRIARDLILPPPPPAAFQQPAHAPAATGRPGDAWAAVTDWEQILTPHGWRMMRQIGGVRYWQRPGKTGHGISASTRDDGGLYVFSTSTLFDPEVPYSKFGALAVLEHGGDHAAAAAQLRRDGYGTPEPAHTFTAPPTPPGAPDGGEQDWWTGIAARHTPLDWQKLFDDTPDEEDWIVRPLLAAGRSVALYSPPKAGKSLLALEIAAAVAAGRPVLGQAAAMPRKVLYVDLENSRRDIRDRLTALNYKPADLQNLVYLSFPSLPALDSLEGGREIMALTLAHHVEAVIIDTVSRVISGKENDADTFAALYRYAMAPLKGLGIAVLRLDHAGKDVAKGQRGSSAKNADVDAVWTLTVAGPVITLQCEMSRTEAEIQVLNLRREKGPLRHEVITPGTGVTAKVQALMAKLGELGVPLDASNRQCQQALNRARVPLNTNDLRKAVSTRKLQIHRSQDHQTNDLDGTRQNGETAGHGVSGLSDDLETSDLGNTPRNDLSQDHQTGETENSLTPSELRKNWSQDHQTGSRDSDQGDKAGVCLTGGLPKGESPGTTDAGTGQNDHEPSGRPRFTQPAGTP